MANLEKVIRITEDDYSTLLGGGTITKDGVTYTYDESALYVIQNEDPPAYAETAGVANTAVADTAGNNIANTYDKKPLVIEVDDTDRSVPQGTYASITAAIAAGRDVVVKVTKNDEDVYYLPLILADNVAELEYNFGANDTNTTYYAQISYSDDFAFQERYLANQEHTHGNITNNGTLQTTDITIANGDKLVVTDASNSNRVARASLTFDGSTTTQALSKKGTWETFYQKPSTGIPETDLESAVQTSLGKADTSVQKITSTDNAIARYDGTGGQIQNSGVTINDSNHVTAAKFITSGGTSSQFVKGDGSLDSGYYVKNGDYIINTRATLENNIKQRLYDRELQDCFWAANIRFVATHKVYNNSDDSFVKDISTDLFKGSYESWNNIVTVDQYAILYLGYVAEEDLLDNASTTNSMAVYPNGRIILQFYTSKRPGEILEAKGFFRNDTDWRDLTVTTNNSVTYFISVPNVAYLKAIRIKYSGSNLGSERATSLTDVSYIRWRDDIVSRDLVTKYPVAQNLYGDVTAPKFITRGGTSSQFVKGNGTLDSASTAANSLLSSLPDWTATPTDTTKLVRRDTGGSASFGQVTFLTVWNYINSKAATVYAPLASPALTGTPTAPTATAGTNTTQIATTAFVLNAVNTAIAGVTQFDYKVVTSLPSTGVKGRIYLISNGGTGQNIYDEYIWYEDTDISGRWEKIGTTEVDLSGYAKLSPTSILTFTGDHMLKGTLTVNNPSSGGSLPLPSEIAIGGNGKITLAGEGDFSKIISGSVTLQDALDEKQEKLLVITINGGDITNNSFSVASGTYARIGEALAAGKEVFIKIDFQEDYEGIDYYYFCRDDHSNSEYTFECIAANTSAYLTLYGNDTGDISSWNFASLESPALTGTPTAPTAATGTNTTQVATTAFVQAALSNMGAGGSEMVDVTITGTTSSASFSTNPYNAIKAVVDDGKIAVLNASVAPLSTTGVLIPVYEYTYSQSGSDFTGYKGKIQNGNYEISVDVQSTSSATVSITSVGSSITVDTALSESSTNPVQNRVITAQILENEEIVATALNNLNDRVELKQDQLVSGTTIKTINNQSILGSGNINISGGGGGSGEENVIEVVKVNGTALTPDANKAVNVQALTGVTVGNTALTPSNGVITIGVDAAPTANSTNVVLSGGIKSYVEKDYVVWKFSYKRNDSTSEFYCDTTGYKYSDIASILSSGKVLHIRIVDEVDGLGEERLFVDMSEISSGYNAFDIQGMAGAFRSNGILPIYYYVLSEGSNDSIIVTQQNYSSHIRYYNNQLQYDEVEIATVNDVSSKQDTLISGTNIKTVNNNSLLGSGNISVGTYSKPSGGIPKTDLASAVQTSLGKADTSLQPDVDNDLEQGTISSSNSQGFDYIIANKDTSSEQTLQDALDAKASISAVNAKYTKPAAGIPDTDLTTAVNVRLLAQLSSGSDDGKIMKYSYSGGGWQAVKPVTIYSGSSAPSSSTGSNGDIYIQTS